jgi:plastocyanin
VIKKENLKAILFAIVVLTSTLAFGSESTEYNVTIYKDSFKFEPNRIVIEVGDTVNWVNQDERRHLTSSVPDGTDQLEIFCPELYPGKVCSHTFSLPGRYPYFCFIHRNMVGEVVVVQ